MIHISSYLHRDEIAECIRRWMYNDLRRADAQRVTRLVQYNNTFVARYLLQFSETLFGQLYPNAELHSEPVRKKVAVKNAIIANPEHRTARIDELIRGYRAAPEHYYGDTPVHCRLFFASEDNAPPRLVGAHRMKRVRRLAEKMARRIIDHIFLAIKRHADAMADNRARRLGIRRENLVTRPKQMIDEFQESERHLLNDLRYKRPIPTGELAIHDVAGIKVILEDNEHDRLLNLLDELENSTVVEVEPHTGVYNATNLIVRHRPDKERIIAQPLCAPLVELMGAIGVSAQQAQDEFADFVATGEQTIRMEVIVANYNEVVESEIGRSMHEDRIIEQRRRQEYRGHLAKNIEYLMQYLFSFAVSAKTELDSLPIQLWNRYLPDYFDEVIRALFDIPPTQLSEL